MTDAVIVDIDGTVALSNGRDPYDMSRVLEDTPNENVVRIVEALYAQGYKILFTSARTEESRLDTFKWLSHHIGVQEFCLFLRPTGDYREDAIVKREIFENRIRPYFNVVVVLDDLDPVVRMWRDIGLTCLQVNHARPPRRRRMTESNVVPEVVYLEDKDWREQRDIQLARFGKVKMAYRRNSKEARERLFRK